MGLNNNSVYDRLLIKYEIAEAQGTNGFSEGICLSDGKAEKHSAG